MNLMDKQSLAVAEVQRRITQALSKSTVSTRPITLIAVSKTKPVADILLAYQLGIRHFGENRAEELQEKACALEHLTDIQWHFIGKLQSRKANVIAQYSHCFHAVDRLSIAQRLSRLLTGNGRNIEVFIQVNISGEVSKSGFPCHAWQNNPDQIMALKDMITEVHGLPHIKLKGIMTMAPFNATEQALREIFTKMKTLSDELVHQLSDITCQQLSMGMSGDFELAIEYGATHVRVGSAIFGQRLAL